MKAEAIGTDTGIRDSAGRIIRCGDRVRARWLEDIGITELDLDAEGSVRYMSDTVTAAFFVEFDTPIAIGFGEEGVYRCARQMLIQAGDDSISFAIIDDV